MKYLTVFLFGFITSFAHATPISYVFGGHVTYVGDNSEYYEGENYAPHLYEWLELGDRYHGRLTFDVDTLVRDYDYDDLRGSCDWGGTFCGGITFFEMRLGDRVISHSFPNSHTNIILRSTSGTSFMSSYQVIGTFDTFNFDHGDISGVDSAYWEGFSGDVDYFVRVSEPTPIALLLAALLCFGLKMFYEPKGRRITSSNENRNRTI